MRREEAWRALAEASEAVEVAFSEWKQPHASPMRRAKAEASVRHYVERLESVIGAEAAFGLHVAYQHCMDAISRVERLAAQLALQARVDASDTEMLRRLQQEQQAAGEALEKVEAETMAVLDEARARDE